MSGTKDAMDALCEARHAEDHIEQGVINAFGGDEALMEHRLPFHDWYFDTYDSSVELLGCKPDFQPTAEQLEPLRALGIRLVFVSYENDTAMCWGYRDGEWHYGKCSHREAREDSTALLREARAENARLRAALAKAGEGA